MENGHRQIKGLLLLLFTDLDTEKIELTQPLKQSFLTKLELVSKMERN